MPASWDPISVLASKVQSGELKAADLVEKSLKLIEEKKDFNGGRQHVFISVFSKTF